MISRYFIPIWIDQDGRARFFGVPDWLVEPAAETGLVYAGEDADNLGWVDDAL